MRVEAGDSAKHIPSQVRVSDRPYPPTSRLRSSKDRLYAVLLYCSPTCPVTRPPKCPAITRGFSFYPCHQCLFPLTRSFPRGENDVRAG